PRDGDRRVHPPTRVTATAPTPLGSRTAAVQQRPRRIRHSGHRPGHWAHARLGGPVVTRSSTVEVVPLMRKNLFCKVAAVSVALAFPVVLGGPASASVAYQDARNQAIVKTLNIPEDKLAEV